MPNFPSFVLSWWLVGVAAVANFTVAFVWTIELAAGRWKTILGMAMQFGWPCGRGIAVNIIKIVANKTSTADLQVLAAWLLPHWRRILQAVSAPCLLVPVLVYFLPESPRWLLAKGRISEAR